MSKWQKNLPMALTLSRMFVTIPIVLIMNSEQLEIRLIAALLFIFGSFTDYLDGYFARKWNLISDWGKIMDPIADKVMVTLVLMMFLPVMKIAPWIVLVLVARDLLIGGVRSVAAAQQMVIAANPGGKWKTALQMIAIPAVMIGDSFMGIPFQTVGHWMLMGSTVLSLSSGVQYFWAYETAKVKRAAASTR